MGPLRSLVPSSLVAAFITGVACTSLPDPGLDTNAETGGADGGTAPTGGAESSGGSDVGGSSGVDDTGATDDGGVAGDGLPCEIDAVLATHCRGCHGQPLLGTTFALRTRDDLLALAPTDPTKTLGERSVERMQAVAAPMPPAPASLVPPGDIAVFADWVGAGMPAGDCLPDDAPSPFDAEPVCSSEVYWTMGDEEDPKMHPGVACIECHQEEDEGPELLIAGTVYPTGHEPDDCYGVAEILVEVTDANLQVVELHANGSGNFMLEAEDAPAGFAPPYLVKVVSDLGERSMAMPVTDGDCNGCHTQDGAEDALGRIVAPW